MGYFSTPIAVTALPEADAVRISVRASESRVDEWTVLHADVESVVTGYEDDFTGWRGVGELRVRVGRSGGDVAFYDGDDRALLRLGVSEVSSFLAHLHAALYELGGTPPARVASVKSSAAPVQNVNTSGASSINAAELESLRGMMQQIMMAVITLTSDVNRMMRQMAEREAERAAAPVMAAPMPVMLVSAPAAPVVVSAPVVAPVVVPEESEMFIPEMRTSDLTGAGLEAKEKAGAGDDLAAAAAALKAAKKRRTKKKEEG